MLGGKSNLGSVQGRSIKIATTFGEISLASVFGVSSNIESMEGSKF